MLTDNDVKETISRAYLVSVSASLGFSTETIITDRDSVDSVIRCNKKLSQNSIADKVSVEVQLKATSRQSLIVNNSHIQFPLPIKNYNDLRSISTVPRILVVFVMPENRAEWIEMDQEKITLKKCAYWYSLKDLPDSTNNTTVTVSIPMTQIFNSDQLKEIFIKASKFEEIINGLPNSGL